MIVSKVDSKWLILQECQVEEGWKNSLSLRWALGSEVQRQQGCFHAKYHLLLDGEQTRQETPKSVPHQANLHFWLQSMGGANCTDELKKPYEVPFKSLTV